MMCPTAMGIEINRRDALRLMAVGAAGAVSTVKVGRVLARSITPATGTGVTIEPLVDVVIPKEALPADEYNVMFDQAVTPPASHSTWSLKNKHVLLWRVVEGTAEIPVTGKTAVIRADGIEETPANGTDLVLTAGDIVVEFKFDQPKTYGNPAASPNLWINVEFDAPPGPDDTEIENVGGSIGFPWISSFYPTDWPKVGLTHSSVRVVMRRATIDPGATMETTGLFPVVRAIQAGSLKWSIKKEGQEPTAPALIISGIPYFPYKPGDTDILTNETTNPVTLYELFLTPENDQSATPVS